MSILSVADLDQLDAELWNAVAVDEPPARYELNSVLDDEVAVRRPHRYYAYADGPVYRCIARATKLLPRDGRRAPNPVPYGRAARLVAGLGLDLGASVLCGWKIRRAGNLIVAPGTPRAERVAIMHGLAARVGLDRAAATRERADCRSLFSTCDGTISKATSRH